MTKTGTTGDCTWTLDDNGVLTISGDGVMGKLAYPASTWGTTIKSVIIENGVTSIGSHAFFSCYNLKSVTIPNSVTSIGDYAFYGCRGLTSVTIPSSVKTIGDGAFEYCRSLTSVTIQNNVPTIGNYTFFDCPNLTSVTIPNSVTTIKERAFGYDKNCYTPTDGFTIYCDKDSAAYNYAIIHGIKYIKR